MRIQFDLPDDYWNRIMRFEPNYKLRHAIARNALEEWLTRHEARDKRARVETLRADKKLLAPIIQDMIDSGEITLPNAEN